MKIKYLFFVSILLISACHSNHRIEHINIIGSWNMVDEENAILGHVTDKLTFTKDGSFNATVYANGDSIISEFEGTYEIDRKNHTIRFATNGLKNELKIIECDRETLKLQDQHGVIMIHKRIN